jgi:hypothetical protein
LQAEANRTKADAFKKKAEAEGATSVDTKEYAATAILDEATDGESLIATTNILRRGLPASAELP